MSHRHLQMSRARTRQKRKALHMLTLSGVLRPSRVELRYALPLLNDEDQSSACHDDSETAVHSSSVLRKIFELMWSFGQHLFSNEYMRSRRSVAVPIRSYP